MKANIYDKILEQLPFGILFFSEGKISFANTSAENILGLSRNKLKKPFEELSFTQKIKDVFVKVREEGKVARVYEENFINYFGKRFLLNFYFIPLLSKEEEILIVLEDRSFFKSIETTKHEHAHVEKLSTLFASMAHEIKNPLGVIKGTLQLIRKDGLLKDEAEAFEIVFSELTRIEKIIQSLLDYSAPQKVNIEKFNILSIIQEIIESLRPMIIDKKVVILKEYDSTFPEFCGDKESLYRAFFNIIKNAVEACFVGGKVTIKVKMVLDMKSRENKKEYNYLLLEVTDTGAGISEEDLKNLFTPFFTTKHGGTGLGMVYAQKVVLDHSGFINVESAKNRGTKVSIFLPMKEIV